MDHYKYLIIGGGMTADSAVQGIRSVDPSGSIGRVGVETDAPYNRPPLSKALWKGDSLDTVWRKGENKNVKLHLGRKVTALDADKKRATDDKGDIYSWEKLLLPRAVLRGSCRSAGIRLFITEHWAITEGFAH